MGQEFQLAPFSEQDKLKENLLRTKKGSYVKLSTATYRIGDEESEETFVSTFQDKLKDGLIRFSNGSYHPIDSIKIVEEADCFVATVIYGDVNAPQVQKLREFRDKVLMQSDLGRAFVDFYYSGGGEKTADFIREHLPSTIPVLRKSLDTLIEKYSA